MLRIGPVEPGDRARALELLTSFLPPPQAAARAARLEAMLDAGGERSCLLWQAGSWRRLRAVAMTVASPGRIGCVYHGPQDPSAAQATALAELLKGITPAALAEGLAFVQVLLRPNQQSDADAFRRAGYRRLAELRYLRRRPERIGDPLEEELSWEEATADGWATLGRIVEDTYIDSLDCPGLRGVRPMEDVLAGHRATGWFRPESWWVPRLDGEPVGCLLMNDSAPEEPFGEIVYLGVRPGFRRRGVGRAMLRHALADAAERRLPWVSLAADAANEPAVKLYAGEGFRTRDRRVIYFRPAIN